MMKRKLARRCLSVLLITGMCVTLLPQNVYATTEIVSGSDASEAIGTGAGEPAGTEDGESTEQAPSEVGEKPGLEETKQPETEETKQPETEKTESSETKETEQSEKQESGQNDENDAEKTGDVEQPAEIQTYMSGERAAVSLPEGVYYISSSKNIRQVLDIAGGSGANGGNVQLYETNVSAAQQWKVSYDVQGYATITNVGSGKVLDISAGTMKNGQNIQQYTSNGSRAQKWIFTSSSGGYVISNAFSKNYVVDCSGGHSSNGTNIQLYSANNSSAQRFYFTKVHVSPVSGTKVIENGTYTICSQLAADKCLDIAGASTAKGANVQLYTGNKTQAQTFSFTYDEKTACYTIVNIITGLALDADRGNPINGTNVHMWTRTGGNTQKWAVTKANDGTYTILNRAAGTALDVAGGTTGNGTNIQLYASNNTKAQKFTMKKAGLLADGIYSIFTCLNYKQVLDIPNASITEGTGVQLYQGNASPAQKYVVHGLGDGSYTFAAVASGQFLTGESGKVVQRSANGKDSQKWLLSFDGSGLVIKNKASGTVMDCTGGNSGNGTKLQLYAANGTAAQRFCFLSTPVINSGLYEISSGLNSKRRVDIAGASNANGANVQLWDSNGTNAQKFWFTSIGNGLYRITSAKSGKALDVKNGSALNGTNVQQWDVAGVAAQSWKVTLTEDGWYTFTNQASGKCLDVSGGRNANGANIQSYAGNNSRAQRWHLIPATKSYSIEDEIKDKAGKQAAACGKNLRSCYNWSASIKFYNNDDTVPSDYDPSQWFAKYGFDNRKGDCYVMAATFVHMARALGYEAYLVEGYIATRRGLADHGWAEIIVNGKIYVCDPSFTNTAGKNGYMITYGTSGTWIYKNYRRVK